MSDRVNLADRHASFRRTLRGLTGHTQAHHGWTPIHLAILRLHQADHVALHRVLAICWQRRPTISDAHLVTLLGIALRRLGRPQETFDRLIDDFQAEIIDVVCVRSNSFTGARRFLVAQPIIAAFAASRGLTDIRHLDLGTGLGLLPRQLNQPRIYERFAPDLRWHPALPYAEIPLAARYGVDGDPLPTLDWVHDCYGPSSYYDERMAELLWSIGETPSVTVDHLDILDAAAVQSYLMARQINTATCNMVLYQYDEEIRRAVVASIVENLCRPGLLLTMEPSNELFSPGSRIEAYLAGSCEALHVADLSDAHALGDAWALPDLALITTSLRSESP